MFPIYKSRKAIACLPTLALLSVAVYSSFQSELKITPHYDESTVELALVDLSELWPEPEVAAAPEPEIVPEPEPEVIPEPDDDPVLELPKPPEPKPEPPKPKPQPPAPAVAKPESKPVEPKPVAAAATPQPVMQPVAAAPAPPPQAPRVDIAAMESRYINALRAELEKYKQYPRGREASLQRPEGNVVVWLVVDRSGKVLDSGIETRAQNMLLNRAAQTSLRRIDRVMPFPEETFSGHDRYRFSATLVYNTEG